MIRLVLISLLLGAIVSLGVQEYHAAEVQYAQR